MERIILRLPRCIRTTDFYPSLLHKISLQTPYGFILEQLIESTYPLGNLPPEITWLTADEFLFHFSMQTQGGTGGEQLECSPLALMVLGSRQLVLQIIQTIPLLSSRE